MTSVAVLAVARPSLARLLLRDIRQSACRIRSRSLARNWSREKCEKIATELQEMREKVESEKEVLRKRDIAEREEHEGSDFGRLEAYHGFAGWSESCASGTD